jgi:TatD DNase family protein
MYSFFDIHSHFNLESFDADLEASCKLLKEKNIGTICVGVDEKSSQRALDISQKYDNVFACIGVHPQEAHQKEYFDTQYFDRLVESSRVVAVGECGLDYFRIDPNDSVGKNHQKKIFTEQIMYAVQHKLPLMLHIRPSFNTYDAYYEVLEILEESKKQFPNLKGNAHFFVGTKEIAQRFIGLGFTVSFTGVITITDEYDEVVRSTPLESMMAETDAPFVAPKLYRGKRCEPWMVEEVYIKIARLKNISVEELVHIFEKNRTRMFFGPES